MDHPTPNSFLTSTIASPRGTTITADGQFRRYATPVSTYSKIGGSIDSRITRILYEVGRRNATTAEDMAPPPEGVLRGYAAYPTSSAVAEDFNALARKYTNFSANFAYSSLSGIVERLGSAVASFFVHGELTTTDIRGGRAFDVHALEACDRPNNTLNSTVSILRATNAVFIPWVTNAVMSRDVVAVIANAACGEGATVAADILELDVVTRCPVDAHVEG
ncbi:hypothetical protein K3495_g13897 [Podosphaera aphanis]|nr:hypothetical protein K3495_g13897 [Podosphaera aphanis]